MTDLTRIILGYFIGLSLTACDTAAPGLPYTLATGTCLVEFCDPTVDREVVLDMLAVDYPNVDFQEVDCGSTAAGRRITIGGDYNVPGNWGVANEVNRAYVFSEQIDCFWGNTLAVGNTASHEFGHLMGLQHNGNLGSFMGPADTFCDFDLGF